MSLPPNLVDPVQWDIFPANGPAAQAPLRIVLGGMTAKIPQAWAALHSGFLMMSNQERPDETPEETKRRRARLIQHCYDAENYALATYLKWDCAVAMQSAFATIGELKTWATQHVVGTEAMTLLRLEDNVSREVVGLLLLRWAWAGSVVFELLNVRVDVKERFQCQPAPALVRAGLDLAELIGWTRGWVETGSGTSHRFWSELLPEEMGEIRHGKIKEIRQATDTQLQNRKLVIKVQAL